MSAPLESLAEYLDAEQAAQALRRNAADLGVTEFARVRNLDFVYSPVEFYPLAPRVRPPLPRVVAYAVDMDGTSTTTEPLALHALEYMVRRFTGRMTRAEWPGLDERLDYPFVIGNSNFRHTEFLVQRYRDRLDRAALRQAFFEALLWTLANVDDRQRRRDVEQTARNCGLGPMLDDPDFQRCVRAVSATAAPAEAQPVRPQRAAEDDEASQVAPWLSKYGGAFHCDRPGQLVSAALDVYYMRYHSILRRIEQGQADPLSRELLGAPGRRLIEPMPGYTAFVALIKGWLGVDAGALHEPLRAEWLARTDARNRPAAPDALRPRLARLGQRFERAPARLALVTASIRYETQAVMKDVLRIAAEQAAGWPIPPERRDRIASYLHDPARVYDGFVNASDAHEARLKPHRDLYSLALHQMSIAKADYPAVVGLEDTEPGIIALRAAGIGCAVALPNRDTHRQNYAAAVEVIHGGLPELILGRNLLVAE